MSELKSRGGELRATVHITRKATGKVETVELVARTTPEQHEQIMGDARHNHIHGASGTMLGQGAGMNNQPKENDDGSHTLGSK